MKRIRLISRLLLSLLFFAIASSAQEPLPEILRIDLNRIEETWNILDQCAGKIWPGWNNYVDVPFLLSYPNGVLMLIGHPNPPPDFELVPGMEIRGKKIYLNRRQQIPVELKQPLVGAAGATPFGAWQGKPVQIVNLKFSAPAIQNDSLAQKKSWPRELRYSAEAQILNNIHELFHCFQNTVSQEYGGELRFNADLNYAVYAEMEGIALESAYFAADADKAGEFIKDFLAARELKRQSMTRDEQQAESAIEVSEGAATFAEAMTLDLLEKNYHAKLTHEDDPYFFGFQHVDYFRERKLEQLRERRESTMVIREKCYPYGSFQALWLNRIDPAWQTGFLEQGKLLDQTIAERLKLTTVEKRQIVKRLKTLYDYTQIFNRHAQRIAKRDETIQAMQKRRGRVYVISFKPTGEFIAPRARGKFLALGNMVICPSGFDSLQMHEVRFQGMETPMLMDQMYYLKWVDAAAKPNEKGYELTFSHQEGESIFHEAVFKTRGFTLEAPKIQVKDRASRVKVTVLSKVKE